MAGTRDKNAPGNYSMEQEAMKKERQHILYPHSYNGYAFRTDLPGAGLNPARIGASQLAKNYVDVENHLFGIGSGNLVNPQAPVSPELYVLDSVDLYEKLPAALLDTPVTQPVGGQRLRIYHSDNSLQRT